MAKALIFDFDGLILDTEVPDYQSWEEIYQSYGCSLPLSEWSACIGTLSGTFDVCGFLEKQIGRAVDREEVRSRRRKRYAELVAAQAVAAGVEETIAEARRLGLRVGLASSSTRDWITGHLSRLGLAASFDCIRCAEDVTHVKPDPELYRSAVAALGLQPHEAIALEDSPNGVLAAKRAGLFCVAVPNTLTCQLPLDHADLRLTSLTELSLATLIAEWWR
jgi:HAD superfamily hydrolase (TIGR01509 family)